MKGGVGPPPNGDGAPRLHLRLAWSILHELRETMGERFRLERKHLDSLRAALCDDGYIPIGPMLGDGAIVYDELESSSDLPAG